MLPLADGFAELTLETHDHLASRWPAFVAGTEDELRRAGRICAVLERLVPSFVACAETRHDARDADLFPAEREALGRAVEKRRREFTTGRVCARLALERLGAPAGAIASGPRGEPLWPYGVVGSITHCDGYRGCAVARSPAVAAVGIDAEPEGPLPAGVLEDVVHGRERDLVAAGLPGAEVDVPRLLFCVKEAVYKAWYPLTGRWLGFEDVEVTIDPARFRVRLLVPGPVVGRTPLTELTGRWTVEDGIIGAAVVVLSDAHLNARA